MLNLSKKLFYGLVFPFVILSFAEAETFSERFSSFDLNPEKIFYVPEPQSAENAYYEAGKVAAWKRYSKAEKPQQADFNGYVLFSDPYHIGHKRISFLLGADCSNFVHRLFQVLGADYPFAKTRHFLAIANRAVRPEGLGECMWEKLKKSFELVKQGEHRVGDVMVYGTTSDDFGERGHMGIVSSLNPFAVLQAKYKKGFIDDETSLDVLSADRKIYFFRYKKELKKLTSKNFSELMQQNYPANNSGCEW